MDTTKGSHTQADAAAEPGSAPLQGVEHVAASRLPTRHGEFVLHSYRQLADGTEHAVLVRGDVAGQEDVLVRLAEGMGMMGDGYRAMLARSSCLSADADTAVTNVDAILDEVAVLRGMAPRRCGW